jgi:hypothetical protein
MIKGNLRHLNDDYCNKLPIAGDVTSKAFPSLVNLLHSLLECCIAVVCLDDVRTLLCGCVHRANNIAAHVIGEYACIHHSQSLYTLYAQPAVNSTAHSASADRMVLGKNPVTVHID